MHRVVPELIIENFRKGQFEGEFLAVGMFLDLSGFSRMTDTLMQHGQHGAEVLARLMHGVFNPLVTKIFEFNGRIVSFAGDGVMVLYPIEGEDATQKEIALKALASAWLIQKQLQEDPDRKTIYGTFSFSVKIGLTLGKVQWRILQSADKTQATYYFRGDVVDNSADAEHQAEAGDIILTKQIVNLLGDDITTRPHEEYFRFIRFQVHVPKPSPYILMPVDVDVSRYFMPTDVVARDLRGEFRQIVNLFLRIPDLPDGPLNQFIQTVFQLRDKYGGLLNRIDFGDKGCNLLLLWGAPVTFENDIQRALNFVLDLQQSVEFPITAGVTYYIAHAGYLGGEMCEDYTCYGWGVNLASRFMTSAPLGDVWVDERVTERTSHLFDIQSLGSQRFKGFTAEQKVNLLRSRRPEMDINYQGRMIGRKEELQQLQDFISSIWNGNFAGVVVISGDAGIGKGRLIHEFRHSQLFVERNAYWAVCPADQILRVSLRPLRRWLRRYFNISDEQSTYERQASFDAKLNQLLASLSDEELVRELDRIRSILASLVDIFWDDSLYGQLDAESRYNNSFLALIAFCKAVSLVQPLVLFLDDAHLLDDDTLTFLGRLKRSLQASDSHYPVFILLTARKHGIRASLPDDLVDTELPLAGVAINHLTELVEDVLGGKASDNLVELIRVRSDGNPYFAGQIVRYMLGENLLEQQEDGFWIKKRNTKSLGLPGDIRALLVARLDQLTQDVKATVQTASVLGREFEVRVLSRMLEPGPDIEIHIKDAEKAAVWMPLQELRYIFYHALLREAAYSMQMRARRQELHFLALQALEGIFGTDDGSRFAELAYHAEQAGERTRAQTYYQRAAEYSFALYQNGEAVEYYTKALGFTSLDDVIAQYEIIEKRVEIFSRMGKRDQQLSDLHTLENWARQLNDSGRLARVGMMRSAYAYFAGGYKEAVDFAVQSGCDKEPLATTDIGLYTQVVWCTALFRMGRLEESMQRAMYALGISRSVANAPAEARILNVMGLVTLEMKDPVPSIDYFLNSLQIARSIKHLELETKALGNLAIAEGSINGNYELAHQYYRDCLAQDRKLGDLVSESATLGNLGFSAAMLGDLDAAKEYHRQALQVSREVGNLYQEENTLINLSYLAGINNDAPAALEFAQRALDLAKSTAELSGEAWALYYAGRAHLLLKEYEFAVSDFEKSIAIRDEMDQPALSMEPIAGLLEASLEMGDGETAKRCAEKIVAHIDTGSQLEGTDEPLRVFYSCYLYLEEIKDSRANLLLQRAKELLSKTLKNFKDESVQIRYIENIPWRKAIRDVRL